jgi:cell wall-associated NlpC family hydrolase
MDEPAWVAWRPLPFNLHPLDMTKPSPMHGSRRARRTGALVGVLLATAALPMSAQRPDAPGVQSPPAELLPFPAPFPAPFPLAPEPADYAEGPPLRSVADLDASDLALRDSIVAMARAQIGRRYVYGGQTPRRGFDCSGLVRYVMAAVRIDLPRTANLQAKVGDAIEADTSALRPGDLLTFGRGKRISHVGIYVGGGRFVHASTKAGRVIETALIRPPARGIKPWRGARSLVALAAAPAHVAVVDRGAGR